MWSFKIKNISFLSKYIIWTSDVLLSVLSTSFSFLFYHYLMKVDTDLQKVFFVLFISFAASTFSTWICKTHQGIIRHSSLVELVRIIYAMSIKALLLLTVAYIYLDYVGLFVYTLIISDWIMSVFLLMLVRVLIVNFYYNLIEKLSGKENSIALIYEVSEASISLAAYLSKALNSKYSLKGFITRDSSYKGNRIAGYPVFYIPSDFDFEAHSNNGFDVDTLLFVNGEDLHKDEKLIEHCLRNNINIRIAPLVEDKDNISKRIQMREVQIEDLLERDEIKIDSETISREISGKVVMVTGGAGSIGSELCRQLCSFHPKLLVLFDFSETAVYNINMELCNTYPDCHIVSVIGNVRDAKRVESQIQFYKPNIIFHAAAYKHVPIMEAYPCEAVRTNIMGTRILADTAVKYGVDKFIMISTDKAVRPSNVMGATKHIAENYVQSLGNAIKAGKIKGSTCFITTRFGNVLGSNGSVIPLFRKQILEGGPVTVTHPDIIRYFMTIPEACRLVLEASFLGKGNDIFIFNMGAPVKIDDMARKMIRLSGYIPDKDIKIVYSGLRPGEKLYEELLYNEEDVLPTSNKEIFRAKSINTDYEKLVSQIDELVAIAETDDKSETVRHMKMIAPEFVSQNSVYQKFDKN